LKGEGNEGIEEVRRKELRGLERLEGEMRELKGI
jgi:hypothetical protein